MLDILKQRLGYAGWCDQEQEETLLSYMEDGIGFLQRYDPAISRDTVAEDLQARALLVEYVRYALSSALDDFPKNYRTELLSLSIRGWVDADEPEE